MNPDLQGSKTFFYGFWKKAFDPYRDLYRKKGPQLSGKNSLIK
jgi:hypothetical protein